jgi:hypothetical protein
VERIPDRTDDHTHVLTPQRITGVARKLCEVMDGLGDRALYSVGGAMLPSRRGLAVDHPKRFYLADLSRPRR